jgi:hypothetical protein
LPIRGNLIRKQIERAAHSFEERSRDVARRGLQTGLEATLVALASSPAFYRLVDEVVLYLVHHPDVENLIHEQTSSLAVEAIDELRARAARADTAFDRLIVALRRRLTR